ncbi:hypothetical protein SAMN05216268_14310 [Streptomyces yunnanensis]|uniref:Uncharacterized protein n=1 Tax=Streptomyces yunnanensis TaxID=156453 RepID=A0A9X8N9J9_9ACTN|nr:hypothetical protein SAMN05216268_14310 [Streptomyces yunnanensis]
MDARLPTLVLTLAVTGLLLNHPLPPSLWAISVTLDIAAAAAIILSVGALSALPCALAPALLLHGLIFAVFAGLQPITGAGPTAQFTFLALASLGLISHCELRRIPPANQAPAQTSVPRSTEVPPTGGANTRYAYKVRPGVPGEPTTPGVRFPAAEVDSRSGMSRKRTCDRGCSQEVPAGVV